MNKAYFTTLADYNIWANNRVVAWLDQISDAQWEQFITGSFSSIRQTAMHIASAEKIWIDFWTGVLNPVFLSAEFTGTKKELTGIWNGASAGVKDFIEKYPEAAYREPVIFRYPNGGEGRMEFWQTFSHIINHSAYHRGQLVNMLRQAGFTGLSSTDQATYYRMVQK